MKLEEYIKALCDTDGMSGFEGPVCEKAAEFLKPFCQSVEIDGLNNVIGYKPSASPNAKTFVLDAHLDQIGFMVTRILKEGFVGFASVGGADPRMLPSCDLRILTKNGPLFGVIASVPPHLREIGAKAPAVAEMLIDTGLSDPASSIQIGDPVVFDEGVYTLGSAVTGRALDDRAGFAAILKVAEALQDVALPFHLLYLGSSQEEVGCRGATVGTFALKPDYGIAIDVGHGKTPDAPSGRTFASGGGVMIGMGPNMHPLLTRRLIKTAKAEDISYQLEVMEGHTGTNAWSMQVVRSGVAMGLLSIPLKYMHTPIESVRLSDVETVVDLLTAFLKDFNGDFGGDTLC